jgi:hypothetical protein
MCASSRIAAATWQYQAALWSVTELTTGLRLG